MFGTRLRSSTSTRLLAVASILLLLSSLTWSNGQPAAAQEPALTISPEIVSCADRLTVAGEDFIPGSEVVVSTGGVDDVPTSVFEGYWGPVTVGNDGTFVADGISPSLPECLGLPAEPYLITASTLLDRGENGEMITGQPVVSGSFTFQPDPDDPVVTLSPDRGSGCGEITVHGENFIPNTYLFITAGGYGGHVFAQVTDVYPRVRDDGTFDVTLDNFRNVVGCRADSPPRDGSRYIVGVSTGRPKSTDDPGPDPQDAHVFTVELAPADRFGQTWTRTDGAVASGEAERTWIWGPPFTEVFEEPYADSPGGLRKVQYFDKARMEITDPNADRTSPWYVTNGLLVREMVEGKVQTGDTQFDESLEPANFPIAGDPGSTSPTYAEINRLGLIDQSAREIGTVIDEYIYTDQSDIRSDDAYAAYGITAARYVPETDHAIASVFWEFMTSEIDVRLDGGYSYTIPLFEDPFYATGYPITEAYWTTTLLRGQPADILWQCFQRRCLTYTPTNEPGWKVEAGNVGQHYYEWRYSNQPVDDDGMALAGTMDAIKP